MNFSGFFYKKYIEGGITVQNNDYNYNQYPQQQNYQPQYPPYQQDSQHNYNTGMPYIPEDPYVIQSKKKIRKHGFVIGICILVFLLAPYILGFMLRLTGTAKLYLTDYIFQRSVELIYSVIFLFLPFFLVYLFKSKEGKIEIEKAFTKPCSPLIFFTSIGFGLMLCYCGDFVSNWIAALFKSFGITLTSTGAVYIPTEGVPLVLFFISTAIAPAIIEEFTMRAVTMQALRKYGDTFAIVMTALVFGLMHRNAVQGIFAFIAGVVFGYICVATGTVWTAVIVHALNNGIYVVFNVINVKNPALFERIYPIILVLIFIIGVICSIPFVLSKKRQKLIQPQPLPTTSEKTMSFILTPTMCLAIIWMLVYTLFVQI